MGSITYRRYTVRPTAVPMRAALNAVETIEPASVRRRLDGGKSIDTWKISVLDMGDGARATASII